MKFLDKPLSTYCTDVRTGIILLLVLAVIRFLMLPAFGIPYASGTTYTSMTILLVILAVYHSYRASRKAGTTYRDVLGLVFALALSASLMITAAIVIDDFGGIDTYFTDPDHGGDLNPLLHMGGHLVVATLFNTLFLWGIGSLILKFLGQKESV